MAEERAVHFSPGEEVEVGNSEKGLKGSWYAAVVLKKSDRPSRSASKTNKKLFVEYKTLMADKQGVKPLRENVNLSRVRPKPPPPQEEEEEKEEADRSFKVDEKVEAFDNDGWWEGTISEVLENQRYKVYFKEIDEEIEYEKSKLRRHFEWIDGRWVCEALAQEQQTTEPMFSEGASVEVRVDGKICGETWFPATVLKQTSNNRFLVELQTSNNNSFQLLKTVDSQHIRPSPPQMSHVNTFQLLEKVDALYDRRWWSGVIKQVLSGGRYIVSFEHQNKLKEFVHSELRFHMDWVDGNWFRDSKEISVTPHEEGQTESPGHVQSGQAGNTDQNIVLASQLCLDAAENVTMENTPGKVQSQQDEHTFQNTDMANSRDASKNLEAKKSPSSFRISSKQTLEPRFSRGRLVEVCLDGDTCYGAWFPATVLQEIDNNDFLVEFQRLRSRARAGRLKETVESRHIRPFPPQTSHVESYQLLERVDAFYDGGWRSGIIKRILTGSRYTVFFEQQKKLKEFSPSELRVHMDWTDGKWSENSKEISAAQHNQCGTESHRQAPSEEAINTDQIIDLTSPLSLDATKNVAAKSLPIQAQTQQDRKTFKSTDMARQTGGNAVKNVASKKSHSPRISRKLDYQLSSKKAGSPGKAHNLDAAKKIKKSASFLSGQAVKAQMSLIACPVREISIGTMNKASGQHDFTTPTTDGRVTCVEGKRARNLTVNEHFLDHSLKRYFKEHLEPLNSGQYQTKHDLESNGPRNHPSVEGCSSHLPNIIGIEADQVVGSPKIQTMACQLKLEVQTPRQKRKPFGGDEIEQHEMDGVSKQKMNAFDRRRQTREKVSSPKASVKGGEHQAGKSQAHDARTETQTEGPEHAAANGETSTFVVQAEDTLKEIEMDEGSNDNRDSDQHISMCIEESYLPSSKDEKGVSSANQPMVQVIESVTWKDAPMRGLEHQNPLNVIDNSYSLEVTAVANQPDEAIRDDEHYERAVQSFLIDDDIPLEDEGLPFVKCSPHWETFESTEAFRATPQQSHFRPLKQFHKELREGVAIGLTMSFTNIVEKIGKAEVDDPLSVLQDWSKALEDLKAYGFNVHPIQARLEEMLRIKEEQGQLNSQLVEAEELMNEKQLEKVQLDTELEELHTEMRNIEEYLNELKKKRNLVEMKNKNQGSEIAELKATVSRLRERFQRARLEFHSVVAAPW